MPETLSADQATAVETVTGTVTLDGTTYEIEVRDITLGELKDLEEREQSGDLSEFEFLLELLDDYLVTPDINARDVPRRRVQKLTSAMFAAWGADGSDIDAAMDDLETPEGN